MRDGDPVAPELNQHGDILVIGEAPGEAEVQAGRPLVGPTGMELASALSAAGMTRGKLSYTNVVCCRPPGNEMARVLGMVQKENRAIRRENDARKKLGAPLLPERPSPADACFPRLWSEVQKYDKLLLIGGSATRTLIGPTSVFDLRGAMMRAVEGVNADGRPRFHFLEGHDPLPDRRTWRVFPTLHPAFVMRARRWTGVFRVDIARAMREFLGVSQWTPPTITLQPSLDQLRAFLYRPGIPFFAYDLETDGIEPLTANIRCIGIGTGTEVMVVSFLSKDHTTRFFSHAEESRYLDVIRSWLVDPAIVKAGWNSGSYDRCCVEAQWGVTPAPHIDGILLHRLVESELPHKLGFVGTYHVGAPQWKCYDGETEVLTPRGWARFDTLPADVEVAEWNAGVVRFVQPHARVDQAYTGPMWRLRDAVTDLVVTPDHKMIYRHAGALRVAPVQHLPVVGDLPHATLTGTTWSRLENLERETFDFSGRVYCVSVPSGFLLVRRNGKVTVAGNTDREGRKKAVDAENDHELAVYNAMDVSVSHRAISLLWEKVHLRDQQHLIAPDHKVQSICAGMHTIGLPIDPVRRAWWERTLTYGGKDKKGKTYIGLFEYLRGLREIVGISDFNPASTLQLRDLIFDRWKLQSPLPVDERTTESGDPSTADNVLRSFLSLPDNRIDPIHREFIRLLRRYRAVQKLLGTYIVKLRPNTMAADLGWDEEETEEEREERARYNETKLGIVDPRTWRVYTGWLAHGTVTGRLSSGKPMNAQTVPDALRDIFAPRPGHILVGADADQLELRVAAALWSCRKYLDAFDRGADPHSMTALMIFGDLFRNAEGLAKGVWDGDYYIVDPDGKWSSVAKGLRVLSKRVQYACIGTNTEVAVLGPEGSKPVQSIQGGDWTWAWSISNQRMEPTRIVRAWKTGVRRTVRVKMRWWGGARGGWREASVVVTPDHLMMLRDGTFRAAGNLREGDRLMPFTRRSHVRVRGKTPERLVRVFNTETYMAEHRVVLGLYDGDARDVHHRDHNAENNNPDNLELLSPADHALEHREDAAEGRRRSDRWRASVANPVTRRKATQKSWDSGTRKAPTFTSPKLDPFRDQIGVRPDKEIAELADCTVANVIHYRKVHGISYTGRERDADRTRDSILVMREKLGVLTDTEIADLVGCQRAAVASLRAELGIASAPRVGKRGPTKLDAFADRVGHLPDNEIAALAGCTPENVAYYRKSRGIPAYWREAPGGTNHVVLAVEDLGEEEVWDIEVEHPDHNFALAAGVFVHNSQYKAAVETVHRVITETETENDDATTELPYLRMGLPKVREMHNAWLRGAQEFVRGWDREIAEWRRQGYLLEPIGRRRRDFLDGENPNELVNFKIQGAASAHMNRAMCELVDAIPFNKWGPNTGLIAQVHDQLVLEVPIEKEQEAVGILNEVMNRSYDTLPGVRLTAVAKGGPNWKAV